MKLYQRWLTLIGGEEGQYIIKVLVDTNWRREGQYVRHGIGKAVSAIPANHEASHEEEKNEGYWCCHLIIL